MINTNIKLKYNIGDSFVSKNNTYSHQDYTLESITIHRINVNDYCDTNGYFWSEGYLDKHYTKVNRDWDE